MLTRDGTCKIGDVGLARSLMTKPYLTQAGTLGTFAWQVSGVCVGGQGFVLGGVSKQDLQLASSVRGWCLADVKTVAALQVVPRSSHGTARHICS